MTQHDTSGADHDSGGSQAKETDGEDLDGSIDKGDYGCGKWDRNTLSTTSNIPGPGSQTSARRSENVGCEDDPGTLTTTHIRKAELKQTAFVVALAGLIGLTSWAIATISTWLVPVYVTAIVLIFVIPHSQRAGGDNDASHTCKLRDQANRAGTSQRPPRVVRDRAIQAAYDSAGASTSGALRSGSDARTLQRARSRARNQGSSVPNRPSNRP